MRKFGVVMLFMAVGFVQAAEYRFVGTEDNLWSNVNNWTADGAAATVLPGSEDDVRINGSCLFDAGTVTIRNFQIGAGGAGDLTMNEGSLTTGGGGGLHAIGWDSEGTLTLNGGEITLAGADSTIGCWANKGIVTINGGRLWAPALLVMSIYDDAGTFVDSEINLNGGSVESYYFERKGGIIDIAQGSLDVWYDDTRVQSYIDTDIIVGFGGQGTLTFDTVNWPHNVTAEHNMHPSPDFYEIVEIGDVELSWDNLEPNHPGASVIVDVWFGTEPNKLSDPRYTKILSDADVTGQVRSSVTVSAPEVGVYYWQVDTENGDAEPNKISGTVFVFETTNDLPPIVDAGVDMVTWVNEPVQLAPTVYDDGVSPVTYLWQADNAGAVFSDPAIEAPTVTIDNAAGAVTLALTVQDGFNPAVSDTVVMNVYTDACQAARDGAGLAAANPEDLVVDCLIDLQDFAAIAAKWLDDYALPNPTPVP